MPDDPKTEVNIHLDGKAEIEKLTAQLEVAKAELAAARADAQRADAAVDGKVASRIALVEQASKALPGSSFTGKSDRDVRVSVIAKLSPTLKLDGKSDEFVSAAFEAVLAMPAPSAPDASLGKLNQDSANPAPIVDELAKSRADAKERAENAWKSPTFSVVAKGSK